MGAIALASLIRPATNEDSRSIGSIGPAAYQAAYAYLWDSPDALSGRVTRQEDFAVCSKGKGVPSPSVTLMPDTVPTGSISKYNRHFLKVETKFHGGEFHFNLKGISDELYTVKINGL